MKNHWFRIQTGLVMLLATASATGCEYARRTYEIDLSKMQDFRWDGKIRVTEQWRCRAHPLLISVCEWEVDHIEVTSDDGRVAAVTPQPGGDPLVTVEPRSPRALPEFAVSDIWQSNTIMLLVDPECLKQFADHPKPSTQPAATRPTPESDAPFMLHALPQDRKPYAAHAEQLTLMDWWAIALQSSGDINVEFQVPAENIVVAMRGRRGEYGPAVVEVRTADGKLLKRFERRTIPMSQITMLDQ